MIRPARELDALRGRLCSEHDGPCREVLFEDVPRSFELFLRLEGPAAPTSLVLELGGSEVFMIYLDRESGRVLVDRERASADERAYRGRLQIESAHGLLGGHTVELRWFVDHSVSELFLAEGVVATTRFYPVSGAPWRLRITTPESIYVAAQVWALSRA